MVTLVDDFFKCILLKKKVYILSKISLKFITMGSVDSK